MKAPQIQASAATASVAALGLAMALGIYQSILTDGRLPDIDLDYIPEITALEQSGDVEGAIRELRMATAMDAGNPGVANLLEEVATRAGDLDSRIVALRAQLRARPFDAEARVRLSQAFVALAREQVPERARRTLVRAVWQAEQAVQSAPDSALAHLALAEALRAAGQVERAQAERAQAGRLDPALLRAAEAESQ